MIYKHAIIGFGTAGILTLAFIPKQDLINTVIIEPAAVGGCLGTEYGNVVANITKDTIVKAFSRLPGWDISSVLVAYGPNDCPLLSDVCKDMRRCIAGDLKRVRYRTERMTDLIEMESHWTIKMNTEMLEAQNVYLCVGATPKTMDLPIPHIPLHVALNPDLLKRYISDTDRVVVFGTSHSGTLILKNLKDVGCRDVYALYKGAVPFHFARDGDTEGLKQESATIADDIVKNAWGDLSPKLFQTTDFGTSFRLVANATFVIYAIGFADPSIPYITKGGERQCLRFRPNTNDFETTSGLWGFGIGFPGLYTAPNGKRYKDVGFGGFIDAIQTIFPSP